MSRELRENVAELEASNQILREALEKIRDQDYRGNRCSCMHIAFEALEATK